jgi:HEAT repeat protein
LKIVQKLSHRELLDQAQHAAQEEDWSLVSQHLQDLILGEETPNPGTELFAEPQVSDQLLNLSFQVLEFGQFQDRWDVAKVLPRFGTEMIPRLVEVLGDEDSDPEAQWFAIRILGDFKHSSVITALIEVLKSSKSEDLSSMAVMALSQIGKTAIAPIASLLTQDSTKLLAVVALGQIRHSETVPHLLQIAEDSDAEIRAIALEALGSFHSAEITQVLINALKDLSPMVRKTAVMGLAFCTDKDEIAISDLVMHLAPMLKDFNLEVCGQAAIALGKTGHSDAATALFDVLKSTHTPESLAIEIIRALSWMDLPEALQFLEQALIEFSFSDPLRLEIVETLGRIENRKSEATQILLSALSQEDSSNFRQAIATALGQLGNSAAIIPLIHLLADPDVGVQLHVIAALKAIDAKGAHQQLQNLAATMNLDLKRGIAIALREWNL